MLGTLVALSIGGLLAGPAIARVADAFTARDERAHRAAAAMARGLTAGLVPAVVVLDVLPHLYRDLGLAAPALAIAGFFVLFLIARRTHAAGATQREIDLASTIVFTALAVHALTDGATLAVASTPNLLASEGTSARLLATSVLVHRVPEGLFVTSLYLPRVGWPLTMSRLSLLAIATVVGAFAGRALLGALSEATLHAVVAFGMGGMVRLATHAHGTSPATIGERRFTIAAFALGVAAPVAFRAFGAR